jgi:hypothetical protein
MMRRALSRKELLRQAVTLSVTVAVAISAHAWPQYAWPIWGAFLFALAVFLFFVLREPVNYRSLTVKGGVIEYITSHQRHVIRPEDIAKLEFVWDEMLYWDSMGSKWDVGTSGGARIEIMDEWPNRRLLLRTFRRYLPGFNATTAKEGMRARKEGRWLCFQR